MGTMGTTLNSHGGRRDRRVQQTPVQWPAELLRARRFGLRMVLWGRDWAILSLRRSDENLIGWVSLPEGVVRVSTVYVLHTSQHLRKPREWEIHGIPRSLELQGKGGGAIQLNFPFLFLFFSSLP